MAAVARENKPLGTCFTAEIAPIPRTVFNGFFAGQLVRNQVLVALGALPPRVLQTVGNVENAPRLSKCIVWVAIETKVVL